MSSLSLRWHGFLIVLTSRFSFFHVTARWRALLTNKSLATEFASYTASFFLIGWAVGGLIFGSLGDRYGRARVLTISLLIYSVCTGLSSIASSFPGFCACLFFTGLGVGGVFGIIRGAGGGFGSRSSAGAGAGDAPIAFQLGQHRRGTYRHGHRPSGRRAHAAIWSKDLANNVCRRRGSRIYFRFRHGTHQRTGKMGQGKGRGRRTGVKFGSYRNLLRHPVWSKHAWLGLILCSAGIVGLWGIGNFHPKIVRSIIESHLAADHLSPTALASKKAYWSSLGLLLQNIGGFFGMLTLAKFAQIKGRRPAFAVAFLLSFVCTILVFKFLRQIGQIYWMLPLMGFGQFSVFGIYAIYLPELFPTSLRSTGTSFCYNFGRLAAASAPFTMGQITKRLGGDIEGFRTAGMWVSLVLLLGILVLPFLPETKDMPLPE